MGRMTIELPLSACVNIALFFLKFGLDCLYCSGFWMCVKSGAWVTVLL